MKPADRFSQPQHRARRLESGGVRAWFLLRVRLLQQSVCAGLLLFCCAAQAVLGEGVASIYQAQQSLASTLKVDSGAQYSVYTHTLPNGTVVREYLSRQDLVFALVWQGPAWPDFELMLGRFYDRFATLSKQRRAGQVPTDTGLVVEMSGLMGALRGRIYLPAQLPEGVTPGEVK